MWFLCWAFALQRLCFRMFFLQRAPGLVSEGKGHVGSWWWEDWKRPFPDTLWWREMKQAHQQQKSLQNNHNNKTTATTKTKTAGAYCHFYCLEFHNYILLTFDIHLTDFSNCCHLVWDQWNEARKVNKHVKYVFMLIPMFLKHILKILKLTKF